MVRAKFKIIKVTPSDIFGKNGGEVILSPVTCGSEENERFFNMTPYGQIIMGTINKNILNQFEVGEEMYVDFTPAKEPKVCKITNGQFSWILEVDGRVITFDGGDNAEYFANLYRKLDYSVKVEEKQQEV